MSAAAPPLAEVSPLSTLSADERQQVITALMARLPRGEAILLLAAVSGTRADLAAVPMALQVRGQRAILDALPPGLNAVVASTLGLATKSAQEYLFEVLTPEEKADPAFLQRVEEEARSRGISLWEAAIKVRWNSMSIDELADLIQRQQDERLARSDAADRPDH